MAFPANPADLEVCFAYGANLASDLTTLTYSPNLANSYVRPRILIKRGRIQDAAETQPTSIQFGLKNPGGVFSPRNITGPHYGQLRRNTPVRVRLDPGTGMVTRGIAYMPDWPVRWTGPDIDDHIDMQASGALRRLGAGIVLQSAMRRRVLSPTEPAPAAYWPCEDDTGATSVASGLPASNPMVGAPAFGGGFGGSAGSLDLGAMPDDAGVTGTASLSSNSGFQVECMFQSDSGVTETILQIDSGTFSTNIGLSAAASDGLPHHLSLRFVQNSPGNVDFTAIRDGTITSTFSLFGDIATTASVTTRNVPTTGIVSHIVVYDPATMNAPTTRAPAATGYAGELASVRFARLCAEEDIPVDVTAGLSEPMGPQLPGTLPDLLRECETSDEATLIERRTGKLAFDPRSSRYNKAVTMTLPYLSLAELLPDDDDRDLLNYATVTTIGGSSATDQQTTGPLGTDKTTGVDRYSDSPSRSLFTDAQAAHHASYLVAKGTVDEPRYTIGLNLRGHPELVTQWLACDIGSRIQVTNPPAIQTGPAPLDLVIEGYEELLDAVEWYVVLYCTPYRINEVLQIENGTGNRSRIAAGPGQTTVNTQRSPTDTSFAVTSASVRWIDSATYPSKFPILVECAGEVMSCTAITGTVLAQTMTMTRGVHGVAKTIPAGSSVDIWRAPCIAM